MLTRAEALGVGWALGVQFVPVCDAEEKVLEFVCCVSVVRLRGESAREAAKVFAVPLEADGSVMVQLPQLREPCVGCGWWRVDDSMFALVEEVVEGEWVVTRVARKESR